MNTVNLGTWNTKLIYPLLMGFFSFLTLLSYKALRTVTYFSNSQKKELGYYPYLRFSLVSCFIFK